MGSKETHTTCEVMAAEEIEKNVQHHVLTKTELPAATREWTGNQKEAKIQILPPIQPKTKSMCTCTRS